MKGSPKGFTLLEVLVALAILGIGLGVIFQGLAQGLRLRHDAAENVRIAIVAERLAGGLLARKEAPTEPETGEEDGLRWRVEQLAAPALALGEETKKQFGTKLVEVRITVTGPSGRSWELLSLLPQKKAAGQ